MKLTLDDMWLATSEPAHVPCDECSSADFSCTGKCRAAPVANETEDLVIAAVRADLLRRSKLGIAKYGHRLSDHDYLTHRQFLQHAYEGALDLANYLKGAIMSMEKQLAGPSDQPPQS